MRFETGQTAGRWVATAHLIHVPAFICERPCWLAGLEGARVPGQSPGDSVQGRYLPGWASSPLFTTFLCALGVSALYLKVLTAGVAVPGDSSFGRTKDEGTTVKMARTGVGE